MAALALACRLLFPAGYMPGTSLAQPIMLCAGQGPMPGMNMPAAGHQDERSGKSTHDAGEHDCPFAGLGMAPLLPDVGAVGPLATIVAAATLPTRPLIAAPGRGMAAPPPPSHAPPLLDH